MGKDVRPSNLRSLVVGYSCLLVTRKEEKSYNGQTILSLSFVHPAEFERFSELEACILSWGFKDTIVWALMHS